MGQSKGSNKSKSKGRNEREFKCCHECGQFGLGVRSREASVFEASKRSLAETRCVDMVNVDLNALEIGAVLLLARNHKIQVGIDSCAAVTVFVHFRCFVTKSLQVLYGSECSKSERQAPRCVILVRESENGRDPRSLGGSVRERHESRCVLPLSRRRYPSVCVPRGMWNETGAGVKRSLRIASRDCSSQCSDDWKELQFRFELTTFGAGTDRGHDDRDCKFRVLETPEVCRTVHPVERTRLRSLVVGEWNICGNSMPCWAA